MTCRQYGAMMRQKEQNKPHPVYRLFTTRTNTIRKHHQRGKISDELRSGNIDADPCCHSEEDSQCRFCDWVSACQFRDGRDRDRLRYILPVKPEEFWKELEEGGGDAWQS